MIRIYARILLAALIALVSFQAGKADDLQPDFGVSGTFSIVAVDPETGVCGAAVASKYKAVGKVVPYVRPGVGAFCTQHWHNPEWGEQAASICWDSGMHLKRCWECC